jgi:hypothetical protein
LTASEPSQFEARLEDTDLPLVTEFSKGDAPLLIAFGGVKGALGMPPFEFFNLTSSFDVKKIYVRDLDQAWYHLGLPGLAGDIDGIAVHLRSLIQEQSPSRVVMCGNSMGGYAALLLGVLLDVDVVQAFSPQTFISRSQRLGHLDFRWLRQMRKVHNSATAQKEYFDLKRALPLVEGGKTELHVHYSTAGRLDKLHAERLGGLQNVRLHPYTEGGHRLIRHLRDSGLLKEILTKSLHGV